MAEKQKDKGTDTGPGHVRIVTAEEQIMKAVASIANASGGLFQVAQEIHDGTREVTPPPEPATKKPL